MRQSTPPQREILPQEKIKFMELNADLRVLKSKDALADYDRAKGTLSESEWSKLKDRIKLKFDEVLKERNNIISK